MLSLINSLRFTGFLYILFQISKLFYFSKLSSFDWNNTALSVVKINKIQCMANFNKYVMSLQKILKISETLSKLQKFIVSVLLSKFGAFLRALRFPQSYLIWPPRYKQKNTEWKIITPLLLSLQKLTFKSTRNSEI